MDPYIILAKTEQGAWIETKEIGTSQWSKQEQLILAQGEDSKKGQLIYLTRKGSFQIILYKMIRFLSEILKKHTKLAKIVKINEIFNRLVFPLNFNRFCHPMTVMPNQIESKTMYFVGVFSVSASANLCPCQAYSCVFWSCFRPNNDMFALWAHRN